MNYSGFIIFFGLAFTTLTIYLTAYLLSAARELHAKRDACEFQIQNAIIVCILYLAVDHTTNLTSDFMTKVIAAATITSIFVVENLLIGRRLSRAIMEWQTLQASR